MLSAPLLSVIHSHRSILPRIKQPLSCRCRPWEVEFEALRDKAMRAASLLGRLFGDGNLEMLDRPFPEQSQLMTNLLNLIDEDGHEGDLLELSGE